jgi:hypothetical protein
MRLFFICVLSPVLVASFAAAAAAAADRTEDRYQGYRPSDGQVRSDAADKNGTAHRFIYSDKPGATQSRCYQTGDGTVYCTAAN